MTWTNADGLTIRFHREEGKVSTAGRVPSADTTKNVIEWDLIASSFNGTTATQYQTPANVFVPKGATLVSASLIVTTPFDSASDTATLTLGLQQQDGTTMDDDGIDVAIAQSAIDNVGERVACDGAYLAATGGGKLAADGYLLVTVGTEAFTAGKAKLIVEYVYAD